MTVDRSKHRVPEKLVAVLGKEATDELIDWMDERLTAMLHVGVDQIRLSPFTARQKVNVLMLENVSNLLLSGDATLVTTEDAKVVWRVPVYLAYPHIGRVGCVGTVDVDARFGLIYYDEQLLADIEHETKRLAQIALQSDTKVSTN